MSTTEQQVIEEFKYMAEQGYMTAHELDWCVGAVRNRLGLTPQTRHQLRDTVQAVLKTVRARIEQDTL